MESDICSPLVTAIRGNHNILLFIYHAMSPMDEYIFMYMPDALEKFTLCKALSKMESGKQVKQLNTNGSREYTSKKFAEYVKS
jgi:hypothetical protein